MIDSWPPSGPPRPYPHPPDLGVIMGRLLERSEATVERLDRIDHRLADGDSRMTQIQERLAGLEARREASLLPGWEKLIKGTAPYAIFLAALAGTGSIDAAVKILGALAK